jgi:hypothetical protein
MRVVKGRVHSVIDCEKKGRFEMTLAPDFDPEQAKTVIYTSPYFTRNETGIITIPPLESEILAFYDEDTNDYYYISTIVSDPKWTGIKQNNNEKPLIEKYVYNSECRPQTMTFKDNKNAGLKIVNDFTKGSMPNNYVSLKSTQGHILKLSDTPIKDCIILRNKDGDGITITANKNAAYPSNSIDIKSKGNYRCVSYFGEIYMGLVEGRDISIVNNSAGYNAFPIPQFGNVNLVSKWKDINIYSEGPTGNVLISTALGVIQLKSREINVYGASVNVNSATNVNLKAVAGNINLDAGGQINLTSALGVNITTLGVATVAGIAGTKIGRSATPLDLNSTVRITAPNLNIGIPKLNDYGR